MLPPILIEEFVSVVRNSLRGFARVKMPSGIVFWDVAIHDKGGSRWAAPSRKPLVGAMGSQRLNGAGKLMFAPVVTFATRALSDRWSAEVIAALEAAHPDAFTQDGPAK